MSRSLGLILWIAISIEVAVLSIVSPELGLNWWLIIIAVLAVELWGAWWLTFNAHLQHALADILVVLWLLLYRSGRWIYHKTVSIKRLKEIRQQIGEPKLIAERSSELVGIHPKILNKPLRVVLGYNKRNRPVVVDLGKEHTLVGGSTQAGKTSLIRSVLIQLMCKPQHRRPDIYIIDLKGDRDDELHKFAPVATYVDEPEAALELLHKLNVEMRERFRGKVKKRPAILIMDEVASLTAGTVEREHRQQGSRLLSLIATKAAASGISLLLATQYPRFDVLDLTVRVNLLRKICLVVDTKTQAEVILGFKPECAMPTKPGEFLLKDGIGLKRGRSLLVESGEVDKLIAAQFQDFSDRRLKLWQEVGSGKKIGDSATGIGKLFRQLRNKGWADQNFIKYGYRHLVLAGVLRPPATRGAPYKIGVDFIQGVALVQKYIQEGKWKGQPKAFVTV